MNTFSFNSFAQVKPASTTSYFKAYTINDNVFIKNAEIKEGTSANGNAWKSLVITFGNEEGIYNDSTFFLDINDPKVTERGLSDMPNGGKRELPSRWEQTYYKLAAIGHAFAPDLIEKFNGVVSKCKTFDDFMTAYKSMIDKVINKTSTSMKLVGRNNNGTVYATLPNCVGIAQAKDEKRAAANNVEVGQWYTWMVSPFGDNLTFSAYEEQRRNELLSAKPTTMPSTSTATGLNIDEVQEGADIVNFDDFLK